MRNLGFVTHTKEGISSDFLQFLLDACQYAVNRLSSYLPSLLTGRSFELCASNMELSTWHTGDSGAREYAQCSAAMQGSFDYAHNMDEQMACWRLDPLLKIIWFLKYQKRSSLLPYLY